MFHLIYKTIKNATGEYYIGKHTTKRLDDGYRGSGRWVVSQPKGTTTTVILYFCGSEQEALELERALVDECINDPLCMNQTRGGRGPFHHLKGRVRTSEERERLGEKMRLVFQSWSEEKREARRAKQRGPNPKKANAGLRNGFYGKKHSAETRAKMAVSRSREERAAKAAGNTNVRGRVWFNDGTRSFMLNEVEGIARGFNRGRIGGWTWKRRRRETCELA